ncbi:hypothetical protein EDB83DRAFT_2598327 [Lactarius deliciosus]|nr:hypothetical protein EDB83DRAFT_2598327 [Lactarius deliciosus]
MWLFFRAMWLFFRAMFSEYFRVVLPGHVLGIFQGCSSGPCSRNISGLFFRAMWLFFQAMWLFFRAMWLFFRAMWLFFRAMWLFFRAMWLFFRAMWLFFRAMWLFFRAMWLFFRAMWLCFQAMFTQDHWLRIMRQGSRDGTGRTVSRSYLISRPSITPKSTASHARGVLKREPERAHPQHRRWAERHDRVLHQWVRVRIGDTG